MTLVDDLQSLDLSTIIGARGSLTASLNAPELQTLLQGGGIGTTLGELGTTVQTLQTTFREPEQLLRPLLDGVLSLSGSLAIDDVPVGEYLEAVRTGAEILSRLFEGLSDNPADFGRFLGRSFGDVLGLAEDAVKGFEPAQLEGIGQLRQMVISAERGLPAEPAAIAQFALDLLLPFPREPLAQIRAGVDAVVAGVATIGLPRTRTAQLVLALDAVAAAAASGDAGALQRALREVQSVRASTLLSLREDLLRVSQSLDGLGIERAAAIIADLSPAIDISGGDTIQFLGDLRRTIEQIEANLDIDLPSALAEVNALFDRAEEMAVQVLVEPIDQRVEELKAWVRHLLSHLPLRELRAGLSRAIARVAEAIQAADLDRYAQQVLEMIERVRAAIGSFSLGTELQTTLQRAEQTLAGALNGVVAALDIIKTEIERLAATAAEIIGRLVTVLRDFRSLIDRLKQAIEGLGIEAAGQQVIDLLTELREKAEALLSEVPLPEPMRPLVEQLIDTLEGIDLDQVLIEPLQREVEKFTIPAAVKEQISAALAKAAELISNLIPTSLIQELEAEIASGLQAIRSFQPGALLSGVTDFIAQAASFIERLDPTQAVAELRQPFQAILDAVDQLSPLRLLTPVIEAYDSLLGRLPVPDPQTGARRVAGVLNTAGTAVSQSVTAPISQLAQPTATGGSAGGGTSSGAGTGGGSGAPPTETAGGILPNDLGDLRPGDAIRLLGYLPAKLREALQGLGTGPAGEVLRRIDAMIGGLAADLRRVQTVLWAVEARLTDDLDALLAPLALAQSNAQLALQARVAVGGGASASLDLDGALALVATIDPGAIRLELADSIQRTRGRAQRAASFGGRADSLLQLADVLERVPVGRLLSSIDSFLAALDPEPVAAALDRMVLALLRKVPALLGAVQPELERLIERLRALLERFSPGRLAHRFLDVLTVLREELDLLNPTRLAIELSEIHAAIRAAIMAYDPANLAAALREPLAAIAAQLRALDPTTLLGDLSFLDPLIERVEAALPSRALAGVGGALEAVGQALIALDPGDLLDTINELPGRVLTAFGEVLDAIRQEIVRLLESLRYATGSASVSVSVSATGGGGA